MGGGSYLLVASFYGTLFATMDGGRTDYTPLQCGDRTISCRNDNDDATAFGWSTMRQSQINNQTIILYSWHTMVVTSCVTTPKQLSGGSHLSACPREIVTVEVKLLTHSFLSLMINSLFASGSWLCYLFVIVFFFHLLTIVFIDCHVFTFETTVRRWRIPS